MASLALSLNRKNININICLVVDGPSYKYYNQYGSYCKIYLHELEPICDTNLKRATVNYARCLCLARQLGGNSLIMEDDILLHPSWFERIQKINLEFDKPWILSLNPLQNFKYSERGYEEFTVPEEVPQRVWCRTFAVIYSQEVLKILPEFMIKNHFTQDRSGYGPGGYDLDLGCILFKLKTPIYECVPGLVFHIGEKSFMTPSHQPTAFKQGIEATSVENLP